MPELISQKYENAFEKMREIIGNIPSIETIIELSNENELKKCFERISPEAHYLIRWIILSCKVHLEWIPIDDMTFVDERDNKIIKKVPISGQIKA